MKLLRTDHGDGSGMSSQCDSTCTTDCGRCKGQHPRSDHYGFKVGDRVRVGKGRAEWTIAAFWGDNGELASLEPVDGYSGTSVLVSRLRAVQ
jgi:hypothetical protein